jgi:large subunit ribosomal protein L33
MVSTRSAVQLRSQAHMAKKKKKQFVKLTCSVCKRVNYFADKLKDPEKKIEVNKFCKWCRKRTLHKQGKK